jgi:hypothetical protein
MEQLMDRTSPTGAFTVAQTAMQQGDFATFFSCLDRTDLIGIARNSVNMLLNTASFAALCIEHDLALELVQELQRLSNSLTRSAQNYPSQEQFPHDPAAYYAAVGAYSSQHQNLVSAYDKALVQLLKSVPNLPAVTAALERHMRSIVGGGSISSELFVGESLSDLVIEGSRAWATRADGTGWKEDIGFIQKKGTWYIRLLAKKPKHRMSS